MATADSTSLDKTLNEFHWKRLPFGADKATHGAVVLTRAINLLLGVEVFIDGYHAACYTAANLQLDPAVDTENLVCLDALILETLRDLRFPLNQMQSLFMFKNRDGNKFFGLELCRLANLTFPVRFMSVSLGVTINEIVSYLGHNDTGYLI